MTTGKIEGPKRPLATMIWTMLALGAAGVSSAAQPPSVLLVTVDALRTDRVSSYGYERPTTPNIDRLLANGVRFTDARTPEPLTNPAMCSMITGIPPHRHAATRNGLRLKTGLESLPRILSRHGWATAAFVSNWTLKDKITGLGEHFDHYEGVFNRKRWFGVLNSEATADYVTEKVLDWASEQLREHPETPFLAWVHYIEPHDPYRFHRSFAKRLGIQTGDPPKSDRYDTEVAAADHAVGELLGWFRERLPADELIVFFAADHGESLGEHGYWGHGRYLYEHSLSIPMGFSWPGTINSGTIDAQADLLDVAPTVLELVGLQIPDDFSGLSWAPVFAGGEEPVDRAICFQAHKGAVHGAPESELARSKGLLSIGRVVGERKEIMRLKNSSHKIFDLSQDPGELDNLSHDGTAPSQELLHCVGEISSELGSLDRLKTRKLDDETVEQLRALGYLE
jgi:arylsulfatase A-like enzyme